MRKRLRILEPPSGEPEREHPPNDERFLAETGGPPKSADEKELIHADKLEAAAKWAAAGFTALLAILLFFGIKEGVLDQALRLNPGPALAVLIFLGSGLLAALFAPALDPGVRMKLWALFGAITALLLIAAAFFPNVVELADLRDQASAWRTWVTVLAAAATLVAAGLLVRVVFRDLTAQQPLVSDEAAVRASRRRETTTAWTAGLLALLVVAGLITLVVSMSAELILSIVLALALAAVTIGFFITNRAISATAGVIVLGVVATSLGLYGATKLSVGSKLLGVDPRVSATLTTVDDRDVLEIDVEAGRLRGRQVLVWVTGTPRLDLETVDVANDPEGPEAKAEAQPVSIWASTLEPDGLDSVDAVIDVPILHSRWDQLTVTHCLVDVLPDTDEEIKEAVKQWKEAVERRADPDAEPPDEEAVNLCDPQTLGITVLDAGNVQRGMELTGRIVIAEPGMLEVTLKGIGVAPGTRIVGEIRRERETGAEDPLQTITTTLAPDEHGGVEWTLELPVGRHGEFVNLYYRQCGPGLECPEKDSEEVSDTEPLASYQQPEDR